MLSAGWASKDCHKRPRGRQFDPTSTDDEFTPANPHFRERHDIANAESVALVLPEATSADFHIRYVGDGVEPVAEMYEWYWSGHEWNVNEMDNGFLAQLIFKGEPEQAGVDSFTVVLFPVLFTFGLSALF